MLKGGEGAWSNMQNSSKISVDEQIIEILHELDESQKQRVLSFLIDLTVPKLSWDEWVKEADKFQEELREKYGDQHFDVVELLNEIREERVDEIIRAMQGRSDED